MRFFSVRKTTCQEKIPRSKNRKKKKRKYKKIGMVYHIKWYPTIHKPNDTLTLECKCLMQEITVIGHVWSHPIITFMEWMPKSGEGDAVQWSQSLHPLQLSLDRCVCMWVWSTYAFLHGHTLIFASRNTMRCIVSKCECSNNKTIVANDADDSYRYLNCVCSGNNMTTGATRSISIA